MSDVLNEIRRLHEHGNTGVLTLAHSSGERIKVLFHEGMIEGASSSAGAQRLGDYLVKSGVLPSNALNGVCQEAQRRKIPLGEAAVRKGAEPAEVAAAVRLQAMELLLRALSSGFTVESYTGALRSYAVPARISFPHLLLEISRTSPAVFDLVAGARIVLRPGIDLSIFSWSAHELSVLDELTYPNTAESLLASTGLSETQLKQILGILRKLGLLDVAPEPDAQVAEEESAASLPQKAFPFERFIPVVTEALLSDRLEVVRNGFSFVSEQFKNLKVQLTEARGEAPPKVLTISSADSEDGKSLVSTNLAFAFAQDSGRRVVIVDCDLRSPSLQRYLGVTSEPGLLQYLANGHGAHCYMRRVENLYFLTTGGIAPSPVEALSMRKMKQLIEMLRANFDMVILDTPPFSPIADARVVTGLSDGLIMVVRRGKTAYSSLDRAFKVVDRTRLLGVVFNDVKPMMFHTYHQSRYYQYGNRPYLQSEDPKKYIEAKS
jgi:capsular exopolysaccharide synthesis family protein